MYHPPKNIFLLGLTSFFNDLSNEMVLSIFPAFFISVLKTGAASLGLVEGLADGAANVIKIYAGRFSDVLHKRKVFIFAGYALAVAARPIYLFTTRVAGVIGLRFADRVGKGLREGPRDAIISLSTPKEAMGRAFGFHRMLDTLGAITGPLIAYLILRKFPDGFNIIFITAFVIGLLAIGSIFFIKDVAGEYKKGALSLGSVRTFSPHFRRYLISLFFLSMGSLPIAVLLLEAKNIGLMIASIPLFYMLYNLSYASFSVRAGRMSDRMGPRRVIRIGYFVLLVAYAVLALAQHVPMLIVGFLLLGLFPALTDGIQRALAAELSEQAQRGSAFGLVNGISGAGLMVAGIGGGFMWQHLGPLYAYSGAGLSVMIGLVIFSTIPKK